MSDYTELFPNIYVDAAQNTRIEGNSIAVSNSGLVSTDTSITANQPLTVNNKQFNENNLYLKNQQVQDSGTLPAGYVTIGFDQNQPYFDSEDFPSGLKYIEARALVIVSTDVQLNPSDEFIFIAGTEATPIVATLPTSPFANTRVHYLGGIAPFFGRIEGGNVDIVLFNSLGDEAFRGTTIDMDSLTTLDFTYTVISTNPTVAQWSGALRV